MSNNDKINRLVVFATVGNARENFLRFFPVLDSFVERLSKQCEELEVYVQHGSNSHLKLNNYANIKYNLAPYMSQSEYSSLMKSADIVICHCGVGSIVSSLENAKKPIVLARNSQFEEHVDDHQIELEQKLLQLNLISSFDDHSTTININSLRLHSEVHFVPADVSFGEKKVIAVSSVGGHRVALEKKLIGLDNEIIRFTDEKCYETDVGQLNLFPSCGRKIMLPIRIIQAFKILYSNRNSILYTTGAGVGLAFSIAARILGMEVYCQESLTRISRPSKWFSVAQYFASKTIVSPWAEFKGDYKFNLVEKNEIEKST